ncbi:MAG: hemolysin family protein [Elusimicrobia bacterium]|nr:hemolysin family protein [Elusimicrobiota bacterium]
MSELIIRLTLFALCFFAAAFFSGAETALTSLSGNSARRAKEKYRNYAKYITFWEMRSNEVLTMLVICMNLSFAGIGVIGASLNFVIMRHFNLDPSYWQSLVMPLGIILATLIFASVLPKTLSRYNAERIAVKVLPFIMFLTRKLSFVIKFLTAISVKVMRVFVKRNPKETNYIDADELDFLLSNEKTSPLPHFSRDMVSKIMDFSETKISQIMTPVANILAVNEDMSKAEIIQYVIETGFSRVPVYKGSMDNIIGIIYSKDLAFVWRNDALISIEDLLRPVYYVPETAKVETVLKDFRAGERHMAIVIDEFGSTIGLATIEDLVEEIVGEISDEHDEAAHETIKTLPSGAYAIAAGESITNVNDKTNLNIPEGDEDFVTINGWVLGLFGKIPKVRDSVLWEGYEIVVIHADEKRVKQILVRAYKPDTKIKGGN